MIGGLPGGTFPVGLPPGGVPEPPRKGMIGGMKILPPMGSGPPNAGSTAESGRSIASGPGVISGARGVSNIAREGSATAIGNRGVSDIRFPQRVLASFSPSVKTASPAGSHNFLDIQ